MVDRVNMKNQRSQSNSPLRELNGIALVLLCALLSFPFSSTADSERQKSLDFEDEVVEGVNKKPLDSLNQISQKDKNRNRLFLYWKKHHFKEKTHETLRELRYLQ